MTRRTLLQAPALLLQRPRPRNIVFILTDDHRFDFIGALGHPWLQGRTPNLDRLVNNGVHFQNAFVTSSLCSPSRASILTGQYMHAHRVLDNFSSFPSQLSTFPQLLQKAGYRTGFYGKWHMGGDSDDRQPGFEDWLSFRGQGEYNNPQINHNGERRKASGYMTDILSAEARRFLRQGGNRPFCLYLSHKAVHFPFQPHPRHANAFEGKAVSKPKSMPYREDFYAQLPEWVKRRRYSRHGVDGAFGQTISFDEAYRGYCQCLLSIDESVGEVFAQLEESRLLNDTLIVYMGDNGFMWGEHGMVDKRAMHEPSMRVPMIAHCPDLSGPRKPTEFALNLDIAPTFLDAAGLPTPPAMHGRSLLPVVQGRASNWRKDFLYEYEWEQDYPYTPTITGLRTERYSFMQYQGGWDISELYDLQSDPDQMKNLVADIRITQNRGRMAMNIPDEPRRKLVDSLQVRLGEILTLTGGDPRRSGKWDESYRYAL